MNLQNWTSLLEKHLPSQLAWVVALLSWPLAKLLAQMPSILEILLVKRPLVKKEIDQWETEKAALLEKARRHRRQRTK